MQAATITGSSANRAVSDSRACPTSSADTPDATGLPSASSPPRTPFCASGTSSAMIAIIGDSSMLTAAWKPTTAATSASGVDATASPP